jgi:hypothetical protein
VPEALECEAAKLPYENTFPEFHFPKIECEAGSIALGVPPPGKFCGGAQTVLIFLGKQDVGDNYFKHLIFCITDIIGLLTFYF